MFLLVLMMMMTMMDRSEMVSVVLDAVSLSDVQMMGVIVSLIVMQYDDLNIMMNDDDHDQDDLNNYLYLYQDGIMVVGYFDGLLIGLLLMMYYY